MEISRELLNTISDNLEAGEQCYLHKQTLELVSYPEDEILDYDPELNVWQEDIKKVESDKNFVQIEKMPSRKSFEVMEEFANSVNNRRLQIQLLTALEGRKPFANFKNQIDNSGEFRELWFKFRREKNIEWVEKQIDFIFSETGE